MAKTTIMDHPLIQHKIGILRRKETGPKDFRELVEEIAMLMCYEATRELPLTEVEVETPICKTTAKELSGKKLVIAPILRAGNGMIDGILNLIPAAKVAYIGIYRDPDTHEPVDYYFKTPADITERQILILDPMLATGGSAVAAVQKFKDLGCSGKQISFLCIIAAPEGVDNLQKHHPDIDLYIGALDEKLNEHAYIVPGLGDAGDRLYGTK